MKIKTVALGLNARADDDEFAISTAWASDASGIMPSLQPEGQILIRSNGTVEFPPNLSREDVLLKAGKVIWTSSQVLNASQGAEVFARLLDLLIGSKPDCHCDLRKLLLSGCQCGCFRKEFHV